MLQPSDDLREVRAACDSPRKRAAASDKRRDTLNSTVQQNFRGHLARVEEFTLDARRVVSFSQSRARTRKLFERAASLVKPTVAFEKSTQREEPARLAARNLRGELPEARELPRGELAEYAGLHAALHHGDLERRSSPRPAVHSDRRVRSPQCILKLLEL